MTDKTPHLRLTQRESSIQIFYAAEESPISPSGIGEPAQSEIIRWRPWPCRKCRGLTSPLGHIIRCYEAGAEGSGRATQSLSELNQQAARRAASEGPWLIEWTSSCPHTSPREDILPRLDSGSEHIVYLDERSGEVMKLTRPGIYGEYYFIGERGLITQCNCTPAEYLIRMRLLRKHFGFAQKPVGATEGGQIVTRQKFVRGDPPSQAEVDAFLVLAGLVPVKQHLWLWKKADQEIGVEEWVGDARSDNFLRTANGIVPIDLRMWQVFT